MKKPGMSFKFCGILLVMLTAPGICSAQRAEIRTENGVQVIRNPKDPVAGSAMPDFPALVEDLRIGDSQRTAGPGFSSLFSFLVDDSENIIALDNKEMSILVFDKTGWFIRRFGRRGQGPDELEQPVGMMLSGGKDIVILDHGNSRLIYFGQDGTCLRRVPLTKARPYFPVWDGREFFYGSAFNFGKAVTLDLLKLDREFSPIATIASLRMPPENEVPPAELMERFYFQAGADGSLIWATNFKYELSVTAPDGKLKRIITRTAEPEKLTRAFLIRELKKRYPGRPVPDSMAVPAHYPKSLPFFSSLACDDDGRVFVKTYENGGPGRKYYDVFDPEGIYTARIALAEDEEIFVVKKKKVYAMIKRNENGVPVIKRYRVDGKSPTGPKTL